MNDRVKNIASLTALAILAGVSYALSYWLRFGEIPVTVHQQSFLVTVGFAVISKIAACVWYGVHQQHQRFVSFEDLMAIAKAATASAVALTMIDFFLLTQVAVPRGVIFIDWGATLLAICAFRAAPRAWRYARAHFSPHAQYDSIAMIYGATEHGEALLRALRNTSSISYGIVGFIDDRPSFLGRRIGGVPVVTQLENLADAAMRCSVTELLIPGGLPGKQVRQIMTVAQQCELSVKVLPSYDQMLGGQVALQPREVAIEDLLGRDAVDFDHQEVGEWIRGCTVLVTGSCGSIGSEICRQLLRVQPARLVALDRSETGQFFLERELRALAPEQAIEIAIGDLTDQARMQTVFAEHRPQIVFHAAAYKHVPLMEQHPGEAVKNIVMATRNVVDAAQDHDAKAFVMISTDKAVNPTSVMGSCKKLAERYVQAKAIGSECRFTTVRFGNVLDSAGSVVPVFRQQIAAGGPITVTHKDIVRYFMMIPEAAQLVIQAGAMGRGGEIFVLDMGEPVRIMDLARDMIRLSGLRDGEDIEIKVTGLRPGEKLYEELYADSESHTATRHPKIMVADSEQETLLAVIHQIGQLQPLINAPPQQVSATLAQIVPRLDYLDEERRAAA